MALKLQTAPAAPCITTAEAKGHLRVTANSEDALIDALVLAATQDAEHLMQRAIMPQAWLLTLDAFASCIKLQRPPVVAVTSVNYAAADTGTVTLLPNTEYQLDLGSDLYARLVPVYGKTWPATRAQIAAVQILFTCGWADAAAVPAVIRQWILLRIGALYENREAWTLGKAIEQNPHLDFMLDRYRVFTF